MGRRSLAKVFVLVPLSSTPLILFVSEFLYFYIFEVVRLCVHSCFTKTLDFKSNRRE